MISATSAGKKHLLPNSIGFFSIDYGSTEIEETFGCIIAGSIHLQKNFNSTRQLQKESMLVFEARQHTYLVTPRRVLVIESYYYLPGMAELYYVRHGPPIPGKYSHNFEYKKKTRTSPVKLKRLHFDTCKNVMIESFRCRLQTSSIFIETDIFRATQTTQGIFTQI